MKRAPALVEPVERWPEWIRALYRDRVLTCTHVIVRVVRGRLPAWLRRGRAGVTRKLGAAFLAINLDDIAVAEEDGHIVLVEPKRAR